MVPEKGKCTSQSFWFYFMTRVWKILVNQNWITIDTQVVKLRRYDLSWFFCIKTYLQTINRWKGISIKSFNYEWSLNSFQVSNLNYHLKWLFVRSVENDDWKLIFIIRSDVSNDESKRIIIASQEWSFKVNVHEW